MDSSRRGSDWRRRELARPPRGERNQASAGSRTFTYDLADRLASTTNSGTTTTYAYDGDDRRVSSTVGGGGADLRLIWDPLAESGIPELALERDNSGSLVRRYLDGPLGAVSMTNGSGTFYDHSDPLGTVTDVTDGTGNAQWKYEYEAYGAQRTATNVSGTAPENRIRFNGQYLDPETGLYHLRARQYDPANGRFGGPDPIETSLSAPVQGVYVYVDARPTIGSDPLGLMNINASMVGGNAPPGGSIQFGAGGKVPSVPVSETPPVKVPVNPSTALAEAEGAAVSLGPARAYGTLEEKCALGEARLLLEPGTTFTAKINAQLPTRGWTQRLVRASIRRPVRTVATRDWRFGANDPATAYYSDRGGYVVRNNRTGEIVQVSDRLNPNWRDPWDP